MSGTFDKIEENHRVYKGFNLFRTDPYGFWEIKTFDNKSISGLNQKYTNLRDAVNYIEIYLTSSKSKTK